MDNHEQNTTERAALRRVKAAQHPPGRVRLSPKWWRGEFRPGTVLLAREECRARRAAKPLKHDPDIAAQKETRRYARWCWEFAPEELAELSAAIH